MHKYERMIVDTFRTHRRANFANDDSKFDRLPNIDTLRPPVFEKESADCNVLMPSSIDESNRKRLLNIIPKKSRHRWFGSMKSSQALAQSVFGNLRVSGNLGLLADLTTDEGKPLFLPDGASDAKSTLEYPVHSLREPRPTEIDVFLQSDHRVAVECKFAETHVGACSMPVRGKCDGTYYGETRPQKQCYLTERGIRYWDYIPNVLNWKAGKDYKPCPLIKPYQLVRNILAVCVTANSRVDPAAGHAVLLYDERNPSFQDEGAGMIAWQECKDALKFPHLLQKCTWQVIARTLKKHPSQSWLTKALFDKYGIA